MREFLVSHNCSDLAVDDGAEMKRIGYSLFQWVSADPNKLLKSSLKNIVHPQARWGQGKVLKFKEIVEIMNLLIKLQNLAGEIANIICEQQGCPTMPRLDDPKFNEKAMAFFEKSQGLVSEAKEYHDWARFDNPGRQYFNRAGDLEVELGDYMNFTIPAKTITEFNRAYCTATGELPHLATWSKILMFSSHQIGKNEDGTRIGYYYRLTESSGADLGFDDDGNAE